MRNMINVQYSNIHVWAVFYVVRSLLVMDPATVYAPGTLVMRWRGRSGSYRGDRAGRNFYVRVPCQTMTISAGRMRSSKHATTGMKVKAAAGRSSSRCNDWTVDPRGREEWVSGCQASGHRNTEFAIFASTHGWKSVRFPYRKHVHA